MCLHRLCLIFLHIGSALTYIPHLLVHISVLSKRTVALRLRVAYVIYWLCYCVIVVGVLAWCLLVICRKRTNWQVIQVTAYVLIAKLLYTVLDVTVRILLRYKYFVIAADAVHIVLLVPAIVITFLLVRELKKRRSTEDDRQLSACIEHELNSV